MDFSSSGTFSYQPVHRQKKVTRESRPFRNNQGGIYQKEFYDDVDHQHFLDHLDGHDVYQHVRVQLERDLSSFCSCVMWWATYEINAEKERG